MSSLLVSLFVGVVLAFLFILVRLNTIEARYKRLKQRNKSALNILEQYRLDNVEKDKLIADMRNQQQIDIDALKRQAEKERKLKVDAAHTELALTDPNFLRNLLTIYHSVGVDLIQFLNDEAQREGVD